MKILLLIGLGSALGGGVRYGLDGLLLALAGPAWLPLGTFCINVTGSFLIGFLAGRSNAAGGIADLGKWHFWTTGVCGGYTTFSTFSWQVLELFRQGAAQEAALYAAGSVGLGLLAVWLGFSLAMKKRVTELRETSASSQ